MTGLRHVGIVVDSIEEAKAVWLEVFNFKVISDVIELGESIELMLGLINVKIRTIKLQANKGHGTIELIEFLEPRPALNPVSKLVNHLGITHIALTVTDLDNLLVKLKTYAFELIGNPSISVSGKSRGIYVSTGYGVLLELVEEIRQ